MIETVPKVERAFRDTTIRKSSGDWLRRVSRQWGVPKPGLARESQWRMVVAAAAMGPRGTYGVTFDFCQWALRHLSTELSGVSVAAANPQRLTKTGGFTQAHIGAWVMKDLDYDSATVWKIVGPADIATSGGNWVELAQIGTLPYWSAANFTTTDSFDVVILPFTIREEPGMVIVNVNQGGSLSPASYLQPGAAVPAAPGVVGQSDPDAAAYNGGSVEPVPNASPLIGADTRPGGEPFGGHLQEEELYEVGDPLGSGPHPVYLSGGETLDYVRNVLDPLLAAGIHAKFKIGGP